MKLTSTEFHKMKCGNPHFLINIFNLIIENQSHDFFGHKFLKNSSKEIP